MTRPQPLELSYADAIALLRKPGRKLVVTHLKAGPEFTVIPGGRITPITAERLLKRCRVADPGLFPGVPQAWRLEP